VEKLLKITTGEYPDISMYKHLYFWLGNWTSANNKFITQYASSCRDLIVGQYRDYYETFGARKIPPHTGTFKKTPFHHTIFAITINGMKEENFHKRIKIILNLLNKFERKLHWKRTTIVDFDKIEYGRYPRNIIKRKLKTMEHASLVVGSKCWNNNPIIFYVYLAVFKLLFDRQFYSEFSTAESFEDLFDKAEEFYGPKYVQYKTASEWPSVVQQRRKIFKGFDLHTLYKPTYKSAETYGVGIRSFMRNHNDLNSFKNKEGVTLLTAARKFTGGKK